MGLVRKLFGLHPIEQNELSGDRLFGCQVSSMQVDLQTVDSLRKIEEPNAYPVDLFANLVQDTLKKATRYRMNNPNLSPSQLAIFDESFEKLEDRSRWLLFQSNIRKMNQRAAENKLAVVGLYDKSWINLFGEMTRRDLVDLRKYRETVREKLSADELNNFDEGYNDLIGSSRHLLLRLVRPY